MWLWMLGWMASATAAPLPEVRRDEAQAPTPREQDAGARLADPACGLGLGWAWPGVGRFCSRRPAEGAALGVIGAVDLAGGIALVPASAAPGVGGAPGLPWVGLQNVYMLGLALDSFDVRLAEQKLYTPSETLGELVRAPFRPVVLAKPGVWLGGGALIGGAIAVTLATSSDLTLFPAGARPNVFGASLPAAAGYPAGAVADMVVFEHVALGEEAVFRGVIQSGLSRVLDPTAGWVLASLAFGLAHVPNLLAVPAEDRLSYLAFSVPYITAAGFTLGALYQGYGFHLSHSVAVHFWYDVVVGGIAFAADPEHGPFSLTVAAPF